MLQFMRTPAEIENRNELVMHMALSIGIDHAKRITDRIARKQSAIYTLFEYDMLSPVARMQLENFLGQWVSGTEDWRGMMEAHEKEHPQPERPTQHHLDDPDDSDGIPPEARHGSHLLEMMPESHHTGHDEGTDSFFSYTRFHVPPEGD